MTNCRQALPPLASRALSRSPHPASSGAGRRRGPGQPSPKPHRPASLLPITTAKTTMHRSPPKLLGLRRSSEGRANHPVRPPTAAAGHRKWGGGHTPGERGSSARLPAGAGSSSCLTRSGPAAKPCPAAGPTQTAGERLGRPRGSGGLFPGAFESGECLLPPSPILCGIPCGPWSCAPASIPHSLRGFAGAPCSRPSRAPVPQAL